MTTYKIERTSIHGEPKITEEVCNWGERSLDKIKYQLCTEQQRREDVGKDTTRADDGMSFTDGTYSYDIITLN